MNLSRIFQPTEASAHCDIPCGIYSPHAAQIAAQTVETMVQKMLDLKQPAKTADEHTVLAYHNSLSRYITVKEQHAHICKQELLILWTDYFKEEHLALFPELHETFWQAAKLCSKNKQEVNIKAAKELSDAVHHIAHMFEKAENLKKKKHNA
jgi:nickel superoxide dismutase